MYLISHPKKFIMCRVMKTGSTSFRESFARMPGVDINNDLAFGKHLSMAEIKEKVNPEVYETYFKFGLVRNPWDRLASYYTWRQKKGRPIEKLEPYDEFVKSLFPGFNNFVEQLDNVPKRFTNRVRDFFKKESFYSKEDLDKSNIDRAISMPQYDFLKGADFIGKLENINQVYNHICSKLNLPYVVLKEYNRSFKGGYRRFYNDKTRKIVEKHYAKDIKMFEYEF